MIINKFIVTYYFFLSISLLTAFFGAFVGVKTFIKWRGNLKPEESFKLQRDFYLATSTVLFGVFIKLVMIPLWFTMQKSLIPLIPGAMCLAGVHINVPFYSWMASGMKIVLPLLYFSWIVIHNIDKKFERMPLFRAKAFFLGIIIFFALLEGYFDLIYIYNRSLPTNSPNKMGHIMPDRQRYRTQIRKINFRRTLIGGNRPLNKFNLSFD